MNIKIQPIIGPADQALIGPAGIIFTPASSLPLKGYIYFYNLLEMLTPALYLLGVLWVDFSKNKFMCNFLWVALTNHFTKKL